MEVGTVVAGLADGPRSRRWWRSGIHEWRDGICPRRDMVAVCGGGRSRWETGGAGTRRLQRMPVANNGEELG
jgi:hypothetical protein